jgi:hypothetical protein
MRKALRTSVLLIWWAVAACSAAPVVEPPAGTEDAAVAVQIRVQCANDAGATFVGDAGGRSAHDVDEIWECQRRCPEGCADALCEVVFAPSVDVQRRCFGVAKPAACMPRQKFAGQLVTGRLCRTDPDWHTWALDPSRVPLGWYAAPYSVQPRDAIECVLPMCGDPPLP